MTKFTLIKQNAAGETIQCEVPTKNGDYSDVRDALKFMDQRQLDLNVRVLQAMQRMNQLNPKEVAAVRNILALVNGAVLTQEAADGSAAD